jgi:nucleoside-diphosphate-sugar epimerase
MEPTSPALDVCAKAFASQHVLVTGSRGYVGASLALALSRVKCRLTLLDHSPTPSWLPEETSAQVDRRTGDVSDPNVWKTILPGVDCVFHLAAVEVTGNAFRVMPDLQVNTLSVLHLMEVCRETGCRPRIINASSANLYGLVKNLPVNEDENDNPAGLWSLHKLTAEHYLWLYAQKYGIPSASLRLANVYGPTPRREAMLRVVINKVIDKAIKGGPLVLFSNHGCVRDYVFLDDVVRAFLLAGSTETVWNRRRHYVIGSGEGVSIEETWKMIIDAVGKRTGRTVEMKTDFSVEIDPMGMRQFVADCRRFEEATGWKALTKLRQGIDSTISALL